MSNAFDRHELNKWFVHNYECWWCGKNHWDSFHHIDGRVGKHKDSILNAAPLNNQECHLAIHGTLSKQENKKKLFEKTIKYLLSRGYELNENDKNFIEKKKRFYQEILGCNKCYND